ncbi:MAG: M28 family peptidase [Planctomycetes bacterium]|nr:M28 family peptidase [Planctomycetota bacterium]
MRSLLVPALLLLAALPGPAAALPDARVDVQSLDLRFEPTAHRIVGEAVLALAGSGELEFLLHANLAVKEVRLRTAGDGAETAAEVASAAPPEDTFLAAYRVDASGATSVRIRYEGTLHDAVRRDEALSFVVGDDCRGLVGPEGIFLVEGSGFHPLTDGLCRYDRIRIDVPEPLRAVTQGRLLSRDTKDGREITTWECASPVDGLALQAGEYVVDTREVDGVLLSTYFFARDREHSKFFLDQTEGYLKTYVELLGPYPWPKFDIVENFFTTGYGMPSYTLLGSDVVQVAVRMAPRYGNNIPPGFVDHELVHCWWGNSVYPDYETGNWCEGLTSYLSNYWRKERENPAEALAHRTRTVTNFAIRVNEANDYPVRDFRGKTEEADNDIGYGKASLIFHMLRRDIGDGPFWAALRTVAREFAGRKAAWKDFEAAFSKTSGKELSGFFAQWLDRKGAPSLRAGAVSVERREDGQFLVKAEVLQDGEPWAVKIPVRAEWAEGSDTKIVDLTGPRSEVSFVLTRPPVRVSVDPDFHVFRRHVYVVPEGSEGYRKLAGMAVARKGGEIVTASAELPAKDCLLFGRPEENPAVARVLAAAGVAVKGNAVTVRGKKHESDEFWLLWSDRHPDAPGRFVTVFFGTTERALAGGRMIYHYGWDGFVAYAGRPLDRGNTVRVRPSTDAPFPLLADPERVKETIDALVDPRLGGRLAGTSGDTAIRALLTGRLAEAGAVSVREEPFTFTVLDFDDPEAWSVPQGDLAPGTPWKTAYPGAVVPAVFSAECPDGIRIRRIAKHPAEPAEGLLLLVSEEASDVPTLLGKIREAIATNPAAVGIPLDVLSKRGFGMLAAYPSRATGSVAESGSAQLRALEAAGDPAGYGVPVVFLDTRLLPPGDGAEAGALLRVRFTRRKIASANVTGIVPDRRGDTGGPKVALGAHFDGLGEGHAGADDNASGVATVLEAVRLLAARRDLLGSPVKVMLFSAEEWGLRGSSALARDAAGLRAFVNLDTVGARDVAEVFVIGRSAHPALAAAAEAVLGAAGFDIGQDIDRFAFRMGSDHWPFHLAGVPSIDLFSGVYRRMNSPDDRPELVDPAKVARIAAAAALVAVDRAPEPPRLATVHPGEERYLKNIRMLTSGGENAEAYFPAEDDRLVFQSKRGGLRADQIFTMNLDGTDLRLLSRGGGATTCSYLFPGSKRVVYATTALSGEEPPPPPEMSRGYVWKLHPEFEIVTHDLDGGNFLRLTDSPGYDAEATISRDGQWIVFTSTRTGDPEIYRMRPDGSEVTRLTDAEGYDGGPFFSFDGTRIVWRASRPKTDEERTRYRRLREHMEVTPTALELWVMNADGSDKHQITDNGAANFGPFFHPDGKRIIFSSNLGSERKHGMPNFDLWIVNVDGTGLARVTTGPSFDGFPMFTADGKTLVFCSNRDNGGTSETNVFLADWLD